MQLETVWLIDDDPDAHFLLARIFRRSGVCAEPRTFLDPLLAIQAFRELGTAATRPDLIVIDMNMPHLDGVQCLQELASIAAARALAPVPSLLLTNALPYDMQERMEQCPGLLDMQEKPLTVQQLQDFLETKWKNAL